MKMTTTERLIYEKMKPGVITGLGFLGTDTRFLMDIIAADEELFKTLGLDFDEVADYLETIGQEGFRGLGEPIQTREHFVVRSDEARGKLPCPWGDGLFHKNSITLTRGEDTIIYSDLSIHMLRVHHFCQGKGSPFRLDPVILKRMLYTSV